MNYFLRAFYVIALGLTLALAGNWKRVTHIRSLFQSANTKTSLWGWVFWIAGIAAYYFSLAKEITVS